MTQSLYYLYLGYSKFKDNIANRLNIMDAQKEIISYLKFLGKVKKGEKINVKGMYVQPDGLITKISRTIIQPDNRENTKLFIINTIRQSIDLLITAVMSDKQSDKILAARIIRDLITVKDNGLKNLKFTYGEDNMFCCQIDTIMEGIDAKLSEVLEKHPELLNYDEKSSPSLSKISPSLPPIKDLSILSSSLPPLSLSDEKEE